jgi:hypothetical protein
MFSFNVSIIRAHITFLYDLELHLAKLGIAYATNPYRNLIHESLSNRLVLVAFTYLIREWVITTYILQGDVLIANYSYILHKLLPKV